MATLAAGTTVGGNTPLSVSGSGTAGQFVKSDGDGTASFGGIDWTEVASRPTALSSFTNDLGNYGGFVNNCADTARIYASYYFLGWTTMSYVALTKPNATTMNVSAWACNCACDCRD